MKYTPFVDFIVPRHAHEHGTSTEDLRFGFYEDTAYLCRKYNTTRYRNLYMYKYVNGEGG